MAYIKIGWENYPSQATPIDEDNLNHMEDGIEEAVSGLDLKVDKTDYDAFVEQLLPVDTESGNPAVITDAFGGSVKALSVSFAPIQSGSGTPSPQNVRPVSGRTEANVVRTGKNVFDASLMVSPTITAKWIQLHLAPNTTYTVSSSIPNSYSSAYIFAIAGTNTSGVTSAVNGVGQNRPQTITTGNDGIVSIAYRTNGESGVLNLSNYTYQVEAGSTATTYEPYTGETITRTYGTTIYGGADDVTGDGVTSDMSLVDMGTFANAWTYNVSGNRFMNNSLASVIQKPIDGTQLIKVVCSQLKYVSVNEFMSSSDDALISVGAYGDIMVRLTSCGTDTSAIATAMNGVQLCYGLTNPTSIPLTAQNVTLLHGDNVLTTDADSIEASYSADIALYIEKKIAEGSQNNRSVDTSSLTKSGSTESTEEVTKTVESEEK